MKIDEKKTEAINQLQVFIERVKAKRGKSISEDDADMLIQYATNLINSSYRINAVNTK
ncbi:MAG: hypothetical protein JRJ00_02385 [Deltaproteobacteria bacterium]|nr:hypothetical protein [Deltaproteobacteria bacterium]